MPSRRAGAENSPMGREAKEENGRTQTKRSCSNSFQAQQCVNVATLSTNPTVKQRSSSSCHSLTHLLHSMSGKQQSSLQDQPKSERPHCPSSCGIFTAPSRSDTLNTPGSSSPGPAGASARAAEPLQQACNGILCFWTAKA